MVFGEATQLSCMRGTQIQITHDTFESFDCILSRTIGVGCLRVGQIRSQHSRKFVDEKQTVGKVLPRIVSGCEH